MATRSGETFTRREEHVVKLVADGLDTQQIADRLRVHRETVKSYIRDASRRLGLERTNRAALVHEAWWYGSIGDRPDLIDEIRRLQAVEDELRGKLALAPSDHRSP